MPTTHRLDLTLSGADLGPLFAVRAGDWGSRRVRARLFVEETYREGARGRLTPYQLPEGALVLHRYRYRDPDGVERITEPFDAEAVSGQEIAFTLPGAPLAAPGSVRGQVTVVRDGGTLTSAAFTVDVLEALGQAPAAQEAQASAITRLLAAADRADAAAARAATQADAFLETARAELDAAVNAAADRAEAGLSSVYDAADALTLPAEAAGVAGEGADAAAELAGLVPGTRLLVRARFAPKETAHAPSPDAPVPLDGVSALAVRLNGAEAAWVPLAEPLYGLPGLPASADITAGTARDAARPLPDAATANWVLTAIVPAEGFAAVSVTRASTGRKPGPGNLLCSHLPRIDFVAGCALEGVWGNDGGALGVVLSLARLAPFGATASRGSHAAAVKAWCAAERDAGRPVHILYEAAAPRVFAFDPPALVAPALTARVEAEGACEVAAVGRTGIAALAARVAALEGKEA